MSGKTKRTDAPEDAAVVDVPPEAVVTSPGDTLKALQAVASKAAADSLKAARAAEARARQAAIEGSASASALAEHAHHLHASAAAFGRAEGGVNQALQALEHAHIHADRAAEALKRTT